MIRNGLTRAWAAPLAIAIALACTLGTPVRAETVQETIPIYFFHDTACGSCDGTEEFLDVFNETLAGVKDAHPYSLKLYNTFQTTGNALFGQVLAEYGLEKAAVDPPAAIVGGKALVGMESIRNNLKESFLTAAELFSMPENLRARIMASEPDDPFAGFEANPGDSTLVFFYRTTCEECIETAPVIDALPASVEIGGKASPVTVVRLNTRAGANIDRILALFQRYEVPEEKQQVPIVFLADTYLSGYEEISARLSELLAEGAGLGFAFPEGAPAK